MALIPQHSLRAPLTDELHARPFTPLRAPAQVISLALIAEPGAPPRTAMQELDHLNALLSRVGAPEAELENGRPPNFHLSAFNGHRLKWERHTEFVTYVISRDAEGPELFDPTLASVFTKSWLDDGPGPALDASLLEIREASSKDEALRMMREDFGPHFNPNSLAAAFVTSASALSMSDFRIDENGFTRYGMVLPPGISARRLGRISQRLFELGAYRALAMLALPMARTISPKLSAIEGELSAVADRIATTAKAGKSGAAIERESLERLTALAADIERLSAESAFRFSAARAYETIVNDRLTVLKEERAEDRQTFGDFMVRRFKPAMRTCRSVEDRMTALATRAERSANLLRTRVDVSLEAQNQQLLVSMDRRAQLQLRLQQTVEGLSVVAISYYAVSLAGYVLAPLALAIGMGAKYMTAIAAPPIILGVWLMVRRIRHATEDGAEASEPGEAPKAATWLKAFGLAKR